MADNNTNDNNKRTLADVLDAEVPASKATKKTIKELRAQFDLQGECMDDAAVALEFIEKKIPSLTHYEQEEAKETVRELKWLEQELHVIERKADEDQDDILLQIDLAETDEKTAAIKDRFGL